MSNHYALCTTTYAKVIGTYTVYDLVNMLMFLKLYPGFTCTHSSNYMYTCIHS